MKRDLGVGYCGLVCALCNENHYCVGCKHGGCSEKETCKNYQCCTKKGYDFCYECNAFPCLDSILHKKRIRAMCKFVEMYGEEKLLDCLEKNEKLGYVYHYNGSHVGDYDQLDTEKEIIDLLLNKENR